MIFLRVQPKGEKHIRISGIDPVLLDSLYALPEILEQRDKPGIRERLLPSPTVSEKKINDEWRQLMTPDLRHLFVSASETVARDLTALEADPKAEHLRQVTFPIEHLEAWMSALNQARLILGKLHKFTEKDMDPADFNLDTPRDIALFRIHILGYLLENLVQLASGHEPKIDL